MQSNEPSPTLFDIRMFGQFAVTYKGKKIVIGRNNTLKYVQLLQLVWLQGEKGITKEHLINQLYDREELSNSNNSLNNLFYQLRQQMVKAGLPKENYIVRRGSSYFMDKKFPAKIDALEFESLINQAQKAEGELSKAKLYGEAFELYEGELLPAISTEIWVMTESLHYKKLFGECVRWLGEYYKEHKDYDNMYRLYSKAAHIYPYDDWQTYQIDSLMARGDYKKAYLIYNETAERYSDEMGVPLSDEMRRCYERMSKNVERFPKEMTEIKIGLTEDAEKEARDNGAYYCSYPGFVDVYRTLSRNIERSGRSIFLMLCTLVDYEGKMISNVKKLTDRSETLQEVIRVSLRKGDVFTRYNKSQFLILLIGTKQEDCHAVYRRIRQNLKEKAGSRAELRHAMTSLVDIQSEIRGSRKLKN